MMVEQRSKYKRIVRNIFLALPYTILKQFLFYRIRKPEKGLPDFLCIGTQKSGTTWLYEQLRKNPTICLAQEKEVHYFDWFFYRPLNWYLSRFNCDKNSLRGEITPGYSVIEKGRIKFIRRIMPDVKLVLLLRDPRERAWSSARYHFGKQMKRDLEGVNPDQFIAHFNAEWVEQRGNYEMIWKKWSSVFPREQLLVVFTEEMEQNPIEVLKRISVFIGTTAIIDETALRSRPNKSDEIEMPPQVKKYLDEHYLPMIERMPEWLGMENKYWTI